MSCTLMGTRVSARSAFAGCPLAIRRTPVVQAPRTLVIENAHKKGAGSTKNGRDSNSKSRGVKVYGGQPVAHGGIIVRQVGNTFHAGINVGTGKDYTLFALSEGVAVYETIKQKSCISVYPHGDAKTVGLQLPKQENSRNSRRLAHWKGVTRGSKPTNTAAAASK